MKVQVVFALVCILYTIQFAMVHCDQALGNRIAAMTLNSANIPRLLNPRPSSTTVNTKSSFQIWIKGTSASDFQLVKSAVESVGCSMLSSNKDNINLGLPHYGYIVARIRCGTYQKWSNLVNVQNFYTKVAFTEKSFFADIVATKEELPETGNNCKRALAPPDRIAYWYGKVNQHTVNNVWYTDSDGVSGANIDKLTYCKKFYPGTTGTKDYTTETITGWRAAGNTGGPWSYAVMTTECIQPTCQGGGGNYRGDPEAYMPTEEEILAMRELVNEMELSKREYFPDDIEDMTVEDLDDYEKRKQYCLTPAELRSEQELTGEETEEEIKRISRIVCPEPPIVIDSPPPPYYPPPPPYYPPPPPSSSGTQPPVGCLTPAEVKRMETEADTEEKREALRKVLPCVDPPTPVPPPPSPPVYEEGFPQTYNYQPTSNQDWENTNRRTWTNYLENLKWSQSIDIINNNIGGTLYSLDFGVQENHIELINPNTGLTKVKRLPNMLAADPSLQYAGFIDPDILAYFGEHPYLEHNSSHGTPNAALCVGNTLGITRNIPLYYAKIATRDTNVDIQAVQNALASVNMLVGTQGHKRPSVVMSPITLIMSYEWCYRSKVEVGDPICSIGVTDELNAAYDNGVIVVLSSGNGANYYDIITLPGGDPWVYTNTIYPLVLCDPETMSAIPIDICDTARRQHDLSFNVWDWYLPVQENPNKRPFIVAAHDHEGKIRRWRNVQYSLASDDWMTFWWDIGSSNTGSCIDFSAPAVELSKTATLSGYTERGHHFGDYMTTPYYLSGTSYATTTAGTTILTMMQKYPPVHFQSGGVHNGVYIERIRSLLKLNGRPIQSDYDSCRLNYWQDLRDQSSYTRLQFF